MCGLAGGLIAIARRPCRPASPLEQNKHLAGERTPGPCNGFDGDDGD